MNLDAIDALPPETARSLLREVIAAHATPAFGALPRRESELVLLDAMRRAGVLGRDASLYELMVGLRISRAKARNLLFDLEIRRAEGDAGLDATLKDAIARPRGFVVDGPYIALGIENPVVQAHMKERVRALGHLTDASFDSAVVRLKPGALAALVEALMSEAELANFRRAMIAAGLRRSTTLRAALVAGLRYLAGRAVGEEAARAGGGVIGAVAGEVADFVQPALESAVDTVRGVLAAAFGGAGDGAGPRIRGT